MKIQGGDYTEYRIVKITQGAVYRVIRLLIQRVTEATEALRLRGSSLLGALASTTGIDQQYSLLQDLELLPADFLHDLR